MHILPAGALPWTTTILETCSPTLTSFKFLKFNLNKTYSSTSTLLWLVCNIGYWLLWLLIFYTRQMGLNPVDIRENSLFVHVLYSW